MKYSHFHNKALMSSTLNFVWLQRIQLYNWFSRLTLKNKLIVSWNKCSLQVWDTVNIISNSGKDKRRMNSSTDMKAYACHCLLLNKKSICFLTVIWYLRKYVDKLVNEFPYCYVLYCTWLEVRYQFYSQNRFRFLSRWRHRHWKQSIKQSRFCFFFIWIRLWLIYYKIWYQ